MVVNVWFSSLGTDAPFSFKGGRQQTNHSSPQPPLIRMVGWSVNQYHPPRRTPIRPLDLHLPHLGHAVSASSCVSSFSAANMIASPHSQLDLEICLWIGWEEKKEDTSEIEFAIVTQLSGLREECSAL